MAAPLVAAAAVDGLSKNKATPYVIGGLILVSTVGGFLLVRGTLKKLGIIEDKEDTRINEKLSKLNHFKPNFYNPIKTTIDPFRAKQIAYVFEKAASGVGTDEEALYGAVREAANPHNMSLVSKEYMIRYEESLIDVIIEEFNKNEKKRLLKTLGY
jgi:hypothetical protein